MSSVIFRNDDRGRLWSSPSCCFLLWRNFGSCHGGQRRRCIKHDSLAFVLLFRSFSGSIMYLLHYTVAQLAFYEELADDVGVELQRRVVEASSSRTDEELLVVLLLVIAHRKGLSLNIDSLERIKEKHQHCGSHVWQNKEERRTGLSPNSKSMRSVAARFARASRVSSVIRTIMATFGLLVRAEWPWRVMALLGGSGMVVGRDLDSVAGGA